jgi:riboflavin kinase/FMN adenylyltransferase
VEVVADPAECSGGGAGAVVTIGAYDGVHLGHRAVIDEVRQRARERGCLSAVVTFDPHPAYVVRPESAPLLLTDLDQKLELLADAGVDRTLVVRFDEARSKESAADFVEEVLVGCLGAKAVVVGHDFHFGHRREGSVPFLAAMGARHGFDVVGLHLTTGNGPGGDDGDPVSSTRIRQLLGAGDVAAAAALLGRDHEVRGVVERGDGRGRELGYPTANVRVPGQVQLPADGVYAGWYVRPGGSVHASCISLGRRPTFYEERGDRILEPYLLDFDEDLYGEPARVRFSSRLRGQERFDSTDALVAQMADDVARTRRRPPDP